LAQLEQVRKSFQLSRQQPKKLNNQLNLKMQNFDLMNSICSLRESQTKNHSTLNVNRIVSGIETFEKNFVDKIYRYEEAGLNMV
jgi:uncharacterized protein YtpQ (UPF0354 family)